MFFVKMHKRQRICLKNMLHIDILFFKNLLQFTSNNVIIINKIFAIISSWYFLKVTTNILLAAANYTIVCCAAFGGYKIIDFSGQYEGWLCGKQLRWFSAPYEHGS